MITTLLQSSEELQLDTVLTPHSSSIYANSSSVHCDTSTAVLLHVVLLVLVVSVAARSWAAACTMALYLWTVHNANRTQDAIELALLSVQL
jgi:hypothetical protein